LGRATDRRPERHSDPQATGWWAYRYDVRPEYRRFHLRRIGPFSEGRRNPLWRSEASRRGHPP
jgi:hypothetical protein